ncbi:MAG: serine hydrolase [Terricaulis sp.]
MNRRTFLTTSTACCALSASASVAQAQPGPRFAEAAAYSADRGGVGFVVSRHGLVLAEDYPNGGGVHTRWPIGAGTRIFAPLLAATLASQNLLSLDDPAASVLWEWTSHPVKATISIRALLNGTSGLAFPVDAPQNLDAALALEPAEAPGLRFADDAASYILLAEIAHRRLQLAGKDPDPARYLTTQVLGEIGCVPIAWTRWPSGAPRLDDGVAVSTRAWTCAGELMRREGVWRGQQLADDQVLREAQRGSFAESRAGFGLWLAAPANSRARAPLDSDLWRAASPAPIDLAMAAGANGARLYFSGTEGLVVARQGGSASVWSDAEFLSLIWRGLGQP